MFHELVPRAAACELAGPVGRVRQNFTNALRRMPVRAAAG